MKHRISISTSRHPTEWSSAPVDVETADQLREALAKLGARRFALYWRDPLGDGHVEGGFRPLEELDAKDFEWVTKRIDFQHREITYDTR